MSEADEQIAVIKWCELHRVPVYHVPNEARRSGRTGAYLKRMGMRAGVPDLCVPVANGGYHGLYIEMKAGKNKPTDNQVRWLELLRRNGYAAFVCYGADNAIECIRRYVHGA